MQFNLVVILRAFFYGEEKAQVPVSQLGSSRKGIIGIFSEVYYRNSPDSVWEGEESPRTTKPSPNFR